LFVLAWLQRYVTRLMYIVDRRPACIAWSWIFLLLGRN
jgi:hypothetical protein